MTLEHWIALAAGLLLLWLAAVTVRRAHERGDGVVTPLGVFALVWGAALVLFAFPLIRYTTTPVGVWLMVYGSIATFIAGCLLAERRFRDVIPVEPEERQRPDGRRLRMAWVFFALLGLVGFAAYVHAVDVVVGWRSIIDSPETVRGIQTNSVTFMDTYGPWKLLSYFNQVAFVLWTLGLREHAFAGRWRVARVLGPLSLVPFLFTGDRTLMVVALLWAAAFQILYQPPERLRRLLVISTSGVVALFLIFSFLGGRVGKTINSKPDVAASLTTRSFDPVALPYLYATGNVPAFSGMVDDPLRPDTHGQLTFLSVVKLLHGFNLWGEPPEVVGAFYPIPFQTYNNFSWLGIFYSDFGVFGVLLLPLIFAFVSTAVVIRAVRRRTLLSVWTASLLIYSIIFTFDNYKFFDTLVSEYLLLGLLVVPFIREDLGPRGVYRRLKDQARAKPGLAAATATAVAAVLVIAAAGLVLGGSDRSLDRSKPALRNTLQSAARLAAITRRDGVYPTPEALASQLRVNDPTIRYVGLSTVGQIPSDPETIGVFTDRGRLVFKARTSRDSTLIYDSDLGPSFREKWDDLMLRNRESITNGGFESGFAGWSAKRGEVADTFIARPGYRSRNAAKIVGKGTSGSPLIFSQRVDRRAPAGSCIRLSAWTRERNLDRPLPVSAVLTNADGSSVQLLIGSGRAEAVGTGDSPWQRRVVVRRLGKTIVGATIFAANTGEQPLNGSAWVDEISLRRTC